MKIPFLSMKGFGTVMRNRSIIIVVFAVLFAVMCVACGKKSFSQPVTASEPEAASVFWEQPMVSMKTGEVTDLRWSSSNPVRPRVLCDGSAVTIIRTTVNSVRVKAVRSGMDIVSLIADGNETICVVTVKDESPDVIGQAE